MGTRKLSFGLFAALLAPSASLLRQITSLMLGLAIFHGLHRR